VEAIDCPYKILQRDRTPPSDGGTFAVRGWDDGSGDEIWCAVPEQQQRIDAAARQALNGQHKLINVIAY